MSAEMELETLFVRLKADASGLNYSTIKSQIDSFAGQLQSHFQNVEKQIDNIVQRTQMQLEEVTKIRPTILLSRLNTDLLKVKDSVKAVISEINRDSAIAIGPVKVKVENIAAGHDPELGKMTIRRVQEVIDRVRDLAMVGADLQTFSGGFTKFMTSALDVSPEQLAKFNNFATRMDEFNKTFEGLKMGAPKFRADLVNMAKAIQIAHSRLEGVTGIPGVSDFARQLRDVIDSFRRVNPTDMVMLEELGVSVKLAHQTMSTVGTVPGFLSFAGDVGYGATMLRSIRDVVGIGRFARAIAGLGTTIQALGPGTNFVLFAANLKLAHTELATITALPGLMAFAAELRVLKNILTSLPSATQLVQFAKNLQNAVAHFQTMGSTTQLKTFATNAITAASGLKQLNTQLAWYVIYMNQLKGMKLPSFTGFGGGGGGIPASPLTPGGGAAFGFDPLRRSLGMMVSMATGMAVGFLGFEMVREVTQFDEQMTRAMALVGLHMRQQGVGLQDGFSMQGVRTTVENEILGLSRRVATGPQHLAEAFRELSAAGYGTAASIEALGIVEQFAFVHTMEAAQAAQHLATLQRQLGMTSNDVATNTTNLRRIADVITSAALVSNLSIDHFVRGLERLNPHMRFLNRGLEDSVALLAAFGQIDPSTAVARAEAILRGVTTAFLRSETNPSILRSGGAPGRDPVGPHMHRFQQGMGVHPIHQLNDSVRLASQAWEAAGIRVFEGGQFVGVAETVRRMDTATRGLNDADRERLFLSLQLRPTAAAAIRELLSSSEAMEQFYLAARRADGVLDHVANDRLQSFSSQLNILKNNLVVLGVEIGRVLVPVLREVNGLLIAGLDAWWSLGGAGRMTIISVFGIAVALLALRFTIPIAIGLLKLLFWDTIVFGAGLAVTALYGLGFVAALFIKGIVFLVSGLWAFLAFAWATTSAAVLFLKASVLGLIASLAGLTLVQMITKIATWALTGAMSALATVVTYLLIVTGLIIISLVMVIATLILTGVIALIIFGAIVSAVLLLAIGIAHLVALTADLDWAGGWNSFAEGAARAFWVTVGFFDNFRHNMNVLMNWMDQNWPRVILNMTSFTEAAFTNLFFNIMIGFARLIVGLTDRVNDFIRSFNALRNLPGFNLIPGLGELPDLPIVDTHRDVARLAGMRFRALGEGAERLPIRDISPPSAGIFSRTQGVVDPNRLNLIISPETRQMIESMFGRPRVAGDAADRAEAANAIGNTFKEISLRRFVLEGTRTEEDTRREEVRLMEEQNRMMQRLVELAEAGAFVGVGGAAVVPFGP